MNGSVGYFVFQILPGIATFLYTAYLAYIITNPAKLKVKMDEYREGTPKYEMNRKYYNHLFLGGWVCVTSFFIFRIAYDAYRSVFTPPILVASFILIVTFLTIFAGGALIFRALKK